MEGLRGGRAVPGSMHLALPEVGVGGDVPGWRPAPRLEGLEGQRVPVDGRSLQCGCQGGDPTAWLCMQHRPQASRDQKARCQGARWR